MRRRADRARLVLALVLACPALATLAQPTAAQRERFTSQCLACHGPQGVSSLPLTPSLAGQHSFYAITQLFLFREGRRDNPVMLEQAKGMSDADLQAFADLIAQLPPPSNTTTMHAPVDGARSARGQALAQRLNCFGCHGADLAGGKQVARLARQREDYLLHTLQGFRAGTRVGYTSAMSEALAGTTPQQLEDLAHFLAHAAGP